MITKEMPIGEVVARHPEAIDIMLKHGLHCVGCGVSPYESIIGGAMGHGLTEVDVDRMVAEINQKIGASPAAKAKISADGKLVSLSKSAAKALKKLMKAEGKKSAALRISLEAGGCAGFGYEMEFVEKAQEEGDETVESQGITIIVDSAHRDQLVGTLIDYKESLRETGFVMKNPNVKSACGCGHSFGV
ncbi:MAG TPA: iron-sulfur cluster assembly accessory protein [Candidatus Norongarragalinales archaeon]|nr:iron-sulfur cluster assembly accessory protein [Candidatus Norongarragalinales archaeon]